MQTDNQKTSIWHRLATIMAEMDSVVHPTDNHFERLASLEARVERVEAACLDNKKRD